jgi:hypothetical protein
MRPDGTFPQSDNDEPEVEDAICEAHNILNCDMCRAPRPATARSEPTENQVQQAAEILSMSPLIEAPKLTWHEWMGLARDILSIASLPRSETPAGGTAKVPEGWRELMLKALEGVDEFWIKSDEGKGWKRRVYLMLAAAPSPDGNEEPK